MSTANALGTLGKTPLKIPKAFHWAGSAYLLQGIEAGACSALASCAALPPSPVESSAFSLDFALYLTRCSEFLQPASTFSLFSVVWLALSSLE